MERLLTVEEASEILAVSRWTVYRLIKERRVVSVLVGRCRRITASSLAEYMDELIDEVA
ncbi:MAG: helix-turn-helix domain-containing protein [Actinopolymorphaceae bacterium]